jgi:hypothetical protein
MESYDIVNVGDSTWNDPDHLISGGTETGVNGGVRINDPFAEMEEPVCASHGAGVVDGLLQPGSYDESELPNSDVNLAPGIFCISGNIHRTQGSIIGSPVVLYLTGAMAWPGQAGLQIGAPQSADCPDNVTYGPADACYFEGIALFGARSNTSDLEIAGNGNLTIDGMIYAPNATIVASGGGANSADVTVNGQIIAASVMTNGSINFTVNYDPNGGHTLPVQISLVK